MNVETSPSPSNAVRFDPPVSALNPTSSLEVKLPAISGFHALPSRIVPHSLKSHYFGAFDLYASANTSSDAVTMVRQYLNGWIRGYLGREWNDALAIGCPKQSRFARHGEVDFSCLSVPSDKGVLPIEAFALEHTDREETGRRWRTEVVVMPSGQFVRLHVGVYHGLRVDYVGAEPRMPLPSLPGFVRGLYSDPGLLCMVNGVKTSQKPLTITDSLESGSFFAEYLVNQKRVLPVILVNPMENLGLSRVALDPERLARSTVGAGTVIVAKTALRRSGPFLQALGAKLGYGYTSGVADGGIRVYLPRIDTTNPRDVVRHRYFKPQGDPLVEKVIRDSLFRCAHSEVLRRGEASTFADTLELCEDERDKAKWRATMASIEQIAKRDPETEEGPGLSNPPDGPEDILRDIERLRAENRRLQDLISELRPKIAELEAQAASALDERKNAKKLREELSVAEELLDSSIIRSQGLERELEDEREARHGAESKADALVQALSEKELGEESRRELKIPTTLPENPEEVVRYLQKVLKPRVVILDNAIATAKGLSERLTAETWQYLVALHQELWTLHFGEDENDMEGTEDSERRRVHRIPARFTEKTSIDYTVNESSTTQKDDKLMRQRRAIIDGKEYDFTPHLRGGSHPDFLRVHFAVDTQKKRILVWHVGGHLDTAGTRRLGY